LVASKVDQTPDKLEKPDDPRGSFAVQLIAALVGESFRAGKGAVDQGLKGNRERDDNKEDFPTVRETAQTYGVGDAFGYALKDPQYAED
jgi:hypothetical protein